jgi:hypothetical protein
LASDCKKRKTSRKLQIALTSIFSNVQHGTSKTKSKTLTHKEKSNILDDLKQGISGKSLAVKYGVGTSTISDIKKNSDIIKR